MNLVTYTEKAGGKKEYCEICSKELKAGDTVNIFGIGGGWAYWCEECSKANKPIDYCVICNKEYSGFGNTEQVERRKKELGEDNPMYIGGVLGKFPPSLEDTLISLDGARKA